MQTLAASKTKMDKLKERREQMVKKIEYADVSSRRVVVGDVIGLGAKAKDMALVIEAQSLPERDIPDYVSPDGNDKVTFTRVPKLDEVPYPVTMEPNLVVEFYSR